MSNTSILLITPAGFASYPEVTTWLAQRYGLSSAQLLKHPDFHLVNTSDEAENFQALQIGDVRALATSMSLKPYQGIGAAQHTVFLLQQIHQASVPAQHALLKSLEEPPPHVQLVLTTDRPDQVLPTIQSRCQIIDLRHQAQEPAFTDNLTNDLADVVKKLPQMKYSEIFALSEQYKERAAAQQFLTQLGQWLYTQNHTHPSLQTTTTLQHLMSAQELLEKNINVRLVLEDVLFNLKQQK